jgi:hypothetical protein
LSDILFVVSWAANLSYPAYLGGRRPHGGTTAMTACHLRLRRLERVMVPSLEVSQLYDVLEYLNPL